MLIAFSALKPDSLTSALIISIDTWRKICMANFRVRTNSIYKMTWMNQSSGCSNLGMLILVWNKSLTCEISVALHTNIMNKLSLQVIHSWPVYRPPYNRKGDRSKQMICNTCDLQHRYEWLVQPVPKANVANTWSSRPRFINMLEKGPYSHFHRMVQL